MCDLCTEIGLFLYLFTLSLTKFLQLCMMIVSNIYCIDDFRVAGAAWRMHTSIINWNNIARTCMDGSTIQHYIWPALHIAIAATGVCYRTKSWFSKDIAHPRPAGL